MAEWFKAAVLKTASPTGDVGSATPPTGGGGGRSEAPHYMVYRAKRLSTSYSFVADEKRVIKIKVLQED